MATLKDIAKELNLNPSTVSRALQDHPAIKSDTKEKVIEYAKKINYFPDNVAQSLQKKSSKIIGVLVPEIKHDFFAFAIDGIEDVAFQAGYTIIVTKSNENYEREVQNTYAMISNRVAGLLVSVSANTKDSNHFKLLLKKQIPLVFFDRAIDIGASTVVVDDYEGAFNAVEFLIKKGYKKIAHLGGPPSLSICTNRSKGYKKALQHNKIPINPKHILCCGMNEQDGINGFATLMNLKDKPDAIFAVNDPVAIGTYIQAKRMNFKIPDDIAVIGFSDNLTSSLVDPPMTTVSQPAYEIGLKAAQLLVDQIKNKEVSSVVSDTVLKTKLIIRSST